MAAHARSMDRARARQYIVPADLRRRIERAVERLITTLDAFNAPDEDIEDGHDAEAFADDEEPSLGATHGMGQLNTWGAQNRAASVHGEDLEYDSDSVADCDLEDGVDREDDPAESGIADHAGFVEQTVGEPSLGSLDAEIDQRLAWHPAIDAVTDGEAQETADEFGRSGVSGPEWLAREARQKQTRAELRALLQRRQSPTAEGRAAI